MPRPKITSDGPNPSGLCMCGCGEKTNLAKQGDSRTGEVSGLPRRYLPNHHQNINIPPPNPSGLCMCGCGQPTPLAKQSSLRKGWVKGSPTKYVTGHSFRSGFRYVINLYSDCWEWIGSMNRDGYGRITYEGKNQAAHRVLYEIHKGPIPEGLYLDHLCRNRRCVNPDHLEPVTTAENVRRGDNTKLSKNDVMLIRQLAKEYPMTEVSKMLGIPYPNLTTIVYRYTWKDVE